MSIRKRGSNATIQKYVPGEGWRPSQPEALAPVELGHQHPQELVKNVNPQLHPAQLNQELWE